MNAPAGIGAARLARLLASTALLVSAITLASRIFGFGRWLVFSPAVGAGGVGTAYQSANQLPNVLFEVIAGGALSGAIVPLLAAPLAAADRATVSRIASALLTWALTVTVPLALLVAVFHRPLAAVLLSTSSGAHEPGTVDLAGRLLLMFAPQLVFYALGAVLVGVLQAHRKFLWPAFMPLLSSIVVMAGYIAFAATKDGIGPREAGLTAELWLGLGTTAGVLALSVPLLLPTRNAGVRLRLSWRFPPGVARRAFRLATAGTTALLAQQASVVTIMLLANRVGGTGAYVVFTYTQAVYLLPYAVLAVPLATVAFPRLSERAQAGTREEFAEAAARGLRTILLASAAGVALLIAAAAPLQEFFLTIDAAGDQNGVPLTGLSTAVLLMSLGLPGWALVAYVSRACYAQERSRYAAGSTAAGWAAAVVASLVLVPVLIRISPSWGTDGPATTGEATLWALALGNSAGMVVAGVLLLIALRRISGGGALAGVPATLLVLVPGAVLGAWAGRAAGEWLMRALDFGPAVSAVLAGLAAGALALGVIGVLVVVVRRGLVHDIRAL